MKYYTFVPNQMIFHLEQFETQSPEALVDFVQSHLQEVMDSDWQANLRQISQTRFKKGAENLHQFLRERARLEDKVITDDEVEALLAFDTPNFNVLNHLKNAEFTLDPNEMLQFERQQSQLSSMDKPGFFSLVRVHIAPQKPLSDTELFLLSLVLQAIFPNNTEINVVGVSPNWIMNGTSPETDNGGGGGPGTRPKPSPPPTPEKPPHWRFIPDFLPLEEANSAQDEIVAILEDPDSMDKAEHIHVLILDSVPPLTIPNDVTRRGLRSLEKALALWGNGSNSELQENPLLTRLLAGFNTKRHDYSNKNGQKIGSRVDFDNLTLWYSQQLALPFEPGGKPYQMKGGKLDEDVYDPRATCKAHKAPDGYSYRHVAADHGLFIAGIIHSLAPKVNLHLVQVLNTYAYGDQWIIAEQFKHVVDQILAKDPEAQIVVNMSFMFDFPKTVKHSSNWKTKDKPANEKQDLQERHDFEKAWFACADWGPFLSDFQAMTDLISFSLPTTSTEPPLLLGRGVVVAAAGNDNWKDNPGGKPAARHPASFDNVIGVSALGKHFHSTTYTNEADHLPAWGFATFGGDESTDPGWADENNGMLGVYICEYPVHDPGNQANENDEFQTVSNETGWAVWSGTSFAAPVISGILARLIANGYSPQEAANIVRDAGLEPPGSAHVLRIRQNR